MKRAVFLFAAVLAIIFCLPNYCEAATITIDISKIYIEYENGEYQVIDFSENPVDYSFDINGEMMTVVSGPLTVLTECELEQSSRISKIAIWVGQFATSGGELLDINGYFAFNKDGTEFADRIVGIPDVPISSWVEGDLLVDGFDVSGITSGAFNLNASINAVRGTGKITIANNSPVEAANMSITIKFAEGYVLYGGSLEAEAL